MLDLLGLLRSPPVRVTTRVTEGRQVPVAPTDGLATYVVLRGVQTLAAGRREDERLDELARAASSPSRPTSPLIIGPACPRTSSAPLRLLRAAAPRRRKGSSRIAVENEVTATGSDVRAADGVGKQELCDAGDPDDGVASEGNTLPAPSPGCRSFPAPRPLSQRSDQIY